MSNNILKPAHDLSDTLAARAQKIAIGQDLLNQTEEMFQLYGRKELTHTLARFPELRSALSSQDVHLVVIGEFSRGKSSLINALLGQDLLGVANEVTTAVSTMVRALPEGETEQFMHIHFNDSQEASPQRLAWSDRTELERWTTELDRSNKESRSKVRKIEIFTDHPLLKQGLVLIDTPGLGSIKEQHEPITRAAIADSHIALWVQATDQLGGTAGEWNFLRKTIQKNFNKFITVINKWDQVLEPVDEHDRNMDEAIRVEGKLERIRETFREQLSDLTAHQYQYLTSPSNLMGVSSFWGKSSDAEKFRRSGIDRLAKRIGEMISTGEALEQIYTSPLRKLLSIQQELHEALMQEQTLLNNDSSLEDQRRQLKELELEIQSLQQRMTFETQNSQSDHKRVAETLCDKLKVQLVEPLNQLKELIEDQVTESYIFKALNEQKERIGLPPKVQKECDQVMRKFNQSKEKLAKEVEKSMIDLRSQYLKKMNRHAGELQKALGSLKVNSPSLEFELQVDFGLIFEKQNEVLQIQQKIEELKSNMEKEESKIAALGISSSRLKLLQNQIEFERRHLAELQANKPQPTQRTRHREKEGVFQWLKEKFGFDRDVESYTETDNSAVEVHYAAEQAIRQDINSKDAQIMILIEEEDKNSGYRMTHEQARKKYEKQLQQQEKWFAQKHVENQEEKQRKVQEIMDKLCRQTLREIENKKNSELGIFVQGIRDAFEKQAQLLEECVKEQLIEPLNAKTAQRESVLALKQQSEANIQARRDQITQGLSSLAALQTQTQIALQA